MFSVFLLSYTYTYEHIELTTIWTRRLYRNIKLFQIYSLHFWIVFYRLLSILIAVFFCLLSNIWLFNEREYFWHTFKNFGFWAAIVTFHICEAPALSLLSFKKSKDFYINWALLHGVNVFQLCFLTKILDFNQNLPVIYISMKILHWMFLTEEKNLMILIIFLMIAKSHKPLQEN